MTDELKAATDALTVEMLRASLAEHQDAITSECGRLERQRDEARAERDKAQVHIRESFAEHERARARVAALREAIAERDALIRKMHDLLDVAGSYTDDGDRGALMTWDEATALDAAFKLAYDFLEAAAPKCRHGQTGEHVVDRHDLLDNDGTVDGEVAISCPGPRRDWES